MKKYWYAGITSVLIMSATACSTADLGTLGTAKTLKDVSSVLETTVGKAKTLKTQADKEALAWDSDAELVQVEGIDIDSSGENDLAGSQWQFSYTDKARSSFYVVIFSKTNKVAKELTEITLKQGVKTASLKNLAKFPYDSDDAILRATPDPEKIPKFHLRLSDSTGTPTWEVEFLDDFGKTTLAKTIVPT